MEFAAICFIVALLGAATIGGILLGYEIGVKQTEKRWSDAVTKAEWNRKHGHSC